MESGITSRLTSEAFIPSVPIETPSETAMVLNSMGVPPDARMPAFTFSARRRWLKLQGMVSIQLCPTPMMGLARSSRENPIARSMARAPARSSPSVNRALCRLSGDAPFGSGMDFTLLEAPILPSEPVRCDDTQRGQQHPDERQHHRSDSARGRPARRDPPPGTAARRDAARARGPGAVRAGGVDPAAHQG